MKEEIREELRKYFDGTKTTKQYFKHLEQIIIDMIDAVDEKVDLIENDIPDGLEVQDIPEWVITFGLYEELTKIIKGEKHG